MDLLIELIVWIFKSLAGDKDKDAKTTGSPPSPKRGPYNYGDNRPTAGARPKTLEEILEEVRQQQANKQGGARPSSRPPPMVPTSAPRRSYEESESQPKMSAKQRRKQKRAQAEKERARLEAEAGQSAPAEPVQSSIESRTLRSKMEERDNATLERDRKYDKIAERADNLARGIVHSKVVSEVQGVNTMGEVQTIGAMEGGLADKKVNTYAEFFKAMRTAPQQVRIDMARRAFVFSEVLGPPKALRGRRRRR